MPNRFTPIQPNTPDDQRIAIINKNFGELDSEGVNKIYRGPDGVPRILIDGSTGVIKVAPEGTDVTSASDSELNFNSGQKVFKIVDSGTVTVDGTSLSTAGYGVSDPAVATVQHSLGYVPAVIAYFESTSSVHVPLPYVSSLDWGSGGFSLQQLRTTISDTQLTVNQQIMGYNVSTSIPERTVRYYLLQESAN